MCQPHPPCGHVIRHVLSLQSSVMLRNLVGNVTAWVESYDFECGCSNSSDSEVLLIDADAGEAKKKHYVLHIIVQFADTAEVRW